MGNIDKTKIGFVGLGKLGFPCAYAASRAGHDVMGYDLRPEAMNNDPKPFHETMEDGVSLLNDHLDKSRVRFGTLEEVTRHAEIIFVAVQTPHEEKFEGIHRLNEERKDFDYSHLESAIEELAEHIQDDTIVVVISTVLPGTVRERIIPLCTHHMKLCYNPYFIAMGTTIQNYLYPEFVLLGVHDDAAAQKVERFYATLHSAPVYRTTLANAELIKVAYNTFIGMKIVFANTMMELCHHLPDTDVDAVSTGLKMANKRLISGAYLQGGMGDGGGCHPRDNIALSWLAKKHTLSFDFFETLMRGRELQTEFLVDLMEGYDLPKGILGTAFKANCNIQTGSPAILLKNILQERGHKPFVYDPVVAQKDMDLSKLAPHVFLVGVNHSQFRQLCLPPGSVVIDPWRMVESVNQGVTLVPVGRGNTTQSEPTVHG